jgi:serine/threonine protein kinase
MPRQGGADTKYYKQGTFGCAFFPPIKCTADTIPQDIPADANVLGKVYVSEKEFKNQNDRDVNVKDIDPTFQFTVPFYGSCKTDVLAPELSLEYVKCKHEIFNGQDQSLYEYSGTDLHDIDVSFADIIRALPPILKGLCTLKKKGFAHCDIRPENIVYDSTKKVLKLIDFGNMMKFEKIVNYPHWFDYRYPYFPLEFRMYHYMLTMIGDADSIKTSYMKNFKYLHSLDRRVYANRKDKIMTTMELINPSSYIDSFVTTTMKSNMSDWKNSFNTNYVKKLDIFALGISLLMVYIRNKELTKNKDEEMVNSFINDVLSGMIAHNPKNRMTPELVLKFTNELLSKYVATASASQVGSGEPKSNEPVPPSPPPMKLQLDHTSCTVEYAKGLLQGYGLPLGNDSKSEKCKRIMAHMHNLTKMHTSK